MNHDFVDRSQTCEGCPLAGTSRFVSGHGHYDCPVFVVGTAPGPTEVKTGKAFSGPAGALVKQVIDSLGLNAYFTNVLKRKPDGKPTKEACWRCGHHLIEEMKRNEALVVLALGSVPWRFFQGTNFPGFRAKSPGVETVHGLTFDLERFGLNIKVVPTFDPSYVQRQGGLNSKIGHQWLSDLEDFVRVVKAI